ncbi:MAG: hypothetical protein IJ475_00350 [Bacilli bacterium]|nr:hypothetical protein [Bacilli bacterium]
MRRGKITTLIVLSFLFLIVFSAAYTYSLFQSDITGTATAELASWNIVINDTNIVTTESHSFSLDNIQMKENSNVADMSFAPGSEGWFDVRIDPSDTDVAIKYEIVIKPFSFDIDGVTLSNENIKISGVELTNNGTSLTEVEEGRYVGIIPYQVGTRPVYNLHVNITWVNDEANNELDSIVGMNGDADADIPMEINFTQYLGEEIS